MNEKVVGNQEEPAGYPMKAKGTGLKLKLGPSNLINFAACRLSMNQAVQGSWAGLKAPEAWRGISDAEARTLLTT